MVLSGLRQLSDVLEEGTIKSVVEVQVPALERFEEIGNQERWRLALDGVKAWTFNDRTILHPGASLDLLDGSALHAFNAVKMRDLVETEQQKKVLRGWVTHAKTETGCGGSLHMPTFLVGMRAVVTEDDWKANPLIQMLRSFYDVYGRIPFVEKGKSKAIAWIDEKGAPHDEIVDTMLAKKLTILVENAWSWHDEILPKAAQDLFIESIEGILADPLYLWKDLKEVVEGVTFMAFSLSKTGKIPNWSPVSSSDEDEQAEVKVNYKNPLRVEDLGNDEPFYKAHVHQWRAVKGKLGKRLPKMIKVGESLFGAPVTDENLDMFRIMTSIVNVIGFVQGDLRRTVEENTVGAPTVPSPLYDHEPYMIGDFEGWVLCDRHDCPQCLLTKEWIAQFRDGRRHSRALPWRAFNASIPSWMTSKSPGAVDSGSLLLRKRTSEGEEIISKKPTSKMGVYIASPAYLSSREGLEDFLVVRPGTTGARLDIGRGLRPIFAIPATGYVFERVWGNAIKRTQSTDARFSMKKSSERSFTDLAPIIYGTTNPRTVNVCTDIRKIDVSTMWGNILGPRAHGLLRSLELDLEERWGPFGKGNFKTARQQVAFMFYSRLKDAQFLARGVDGPAPKRHDQLLSGEFMTSMTHNVTNSIATKMIAEEIQSLGTRMRNALEHAKMTYVNITGDDVVSIFEVSGWSDDHQFIIENAIERVIRKLDMTLNTFKTAVRRFFAEYLKKIAVYGVSIPNALRLRTLETEKGSDVNLREVYSMFTSRFTERVARGADHGKSLKFRNMLVMLKTRVRQSFTRSGRKVAAYTILPAVVPFAPNEYGGGGVNRTSLIAPNTDVAVWLGLSAEDKSYMKKHIKWMKTLEWAEDIHASAKEILVDYERILREMNMYLSHERMTRAIEAKIYLKRAFNLTLPDRYYYPKSNEFQLNDKVPEIKEVVGALTAEREKSLMQISRPFETTTSPLTELDYLEDITIELGAEITELPFDFVCPVAGAKGLFLDLIRKLGVAGSKPRALAPLRSALAGLRDGEFPDYLTDEDVYRAFAELPAEVGSSSAAVLNLFIHMGASPDNAQFAVARLLNLNFSPLEMLAYLKYSFANPILGNLDLSAARSTDLVTADVEVPLGMAVLQTILRDTGMQYIIQHPPLRKAKVTVNKNFKDRWSRIMRAPHQVGLLSPELP
jgi:hypothetical protein